MVTALKIVAFELLMYVTNYIIGALPSRRLRLAYYRHVMKFEIGPDAYIFMGARFDSRHGFKLGKNSVINENCRLDNRGTLVIGEFVSISADTVILTADHDVQAADFAGRERPVVIGDYVFIGTRSMILPGVTIGRGAVVGAGSVVTRDIPEYAIVAGSPARTVGRRNETFLYKIDYGRLFH